MKNKHLLLMLLLALMAPWAAQAQQCEISYNLTDSYGDGWNGGSMVVTDATTSTQLASLTISNGSSLVGTIPVTSGHEITFSYTAGSYAYENSWVFTDIAGTTIWESSGDGGSQSYTYTAECPSCLPPSDITVTLTPGQGTIATFSWSSDATAWQICFNNDESNLFDVNRPSFTYNGFTPETQYTVKVRTNCDGQYSSWSSPVTFTPTNAYQITVNDGTSTNEYVPIYGYYVDSNTKSQFIIPANVLDNMAYGTITQLTFYASQSSINWGNATFEVYMSETAGTTVSTLVDWSTMTKVRNAASLSIVNNMMVVVFDTPYEYQGGNLMIGFNQPTTGSYVRSNWYGVSATGASIGGYGSSVSQKNFLPKTTFSYIPGEAPACPKPMSLTASDVTAHGATVAWTSDASAWEIQLNEEEVITVTEPTYTFTGLAPETSYSVKVRANCDGAYSDWTAPVSFTTGIACPVPTQILVSDITAYTAVVSWVSEAERFSLQLGENVFENVTSPYTLTDLTPNTSYTVKVKAICGGEDGESQWTSGTSFMTAEICPEGMVCIGTGTATSNYMPLNNYYKYSLTEQIYTAAEIGEDGAILSIDFYKAATIETVKDLDIYIVSTNKTEFASNTDWIQVTASDLVYSGTVTFADNAWTTIELDSPFLYDGVSNICIVVDNNTGSYVSNTAFRIFNASNNQTLYYQSDSNNLDPTTAISQSASGKTAQKNRIRLNIGEPPACPKPTGVTVSDVTAHEATISWTSDASAWQIQLGEETAINVTEPTYTFSRLAPETAYSVKVRANCDGTYSDWANVSFTTGIACPAPTGLASSNITGHGVTMTWTAEEGAMYQCMMIETSFYNEQEGINWCEPFGENTATWNNLDPETNYTFFLRKDCSAAEDGYSQIVTKTFTTDVACPAPTGLTVALTPGNGSVATLSWTNDASEWVVAYKVSTDTVFTEVPVSEKPYTLTNLIPETTYSVKVKAVCGGNDGESQWSSIKDFTPTNAYMITVNDGDPQTTNNYVPVYGLYVDDKSYSQFIIPANALAAMVYGTINKMTFYSSSVNIPWTGAKFEVYMTETNETTLSALADWSTMDKVMNEAHLEISGNQMVVTLDTPFEYLGGNLMVGIKQTVSGSYASAYFYGVPANGASMGGYGTSVSQRNFLPKTTFAYEPGEAPACPKPTGLAVNYTGGLTATVTWEGDATSYNIDVNGTVTENVTSPYTLEGLEMATTYAVMVQANCGEDLSEWTNAVSFTTDLCMPENQCEISYSFTDAYNDSWNGAYISVVDVATEEILYDLTMPNVTGPYEGSFAVCDGREIQFVWHSGSYDSECSFVIKDLNDEVIVEGASSALPFNYTVNCTEITCKKPKDLAAFDINKKSVVLSWTPGTEDQNAWRIAYMSENDTIYSYKNVTANPYTLNGLTPETSYTVKVRANCGGGDWSDWSDEISFTTAEACPTEIFNFNVSNITVHNALVTWNGDYDHYQVRYKGGEMTDWSEELTTNSPSIALTGLTAETNYDYQVQGYCADAGAFTDWVSGLGFTTEAICAAPDNLLVIPSITTANISWTGYLASYTVAWGEYSAEGVTGNNFMMDNLQPSTTYTAIVTGEGCEEAISASIEFTTGAGWTDDNVWADEGVIADGVTVVVTGEDGEDGVIDAGEITVGDGSVIVIEDGAELIFTTEDDQPIPVIITFGDDDEEEDEEEGGGGKDDIIEYGKYRLIAPPTFITDPITNERYLPVDTTHLMDNYYENDLYSFDQSYPAAEWRNYKWADNNFVNLNWKQGYLYSYVTSTGVWPGYAMPTGNGANVDINLVYNENANFPGANLIGNPFIVKGYPGMPFYVLNNAGTEIVSKNVGASVALGKGFFVIANEPGLTCAITTNAPEAKKALNITLSQGRGMIDAAFINFSEIENMRKFQLNPNHTKIYMPFEGKDYAVLQGEELGEMPINFEAEKNGTYTLSFESSEVEFSYLHLIDNLTGVETNLLKTPAYTFNANVSDYASRFRLVYATGSSVSGNGSFGFVNEAGNLCIFGIEGEATLQVVDVTGRVLSSKQFSGSYESKLNVAPGVYMLRLINGNDVKVQKIVME